MDAKSNSKIKTLGDYIKQVTDSEKEKTQVWVNRNVWNDPELAKDDYLVYPEDDGYDTPKNPYGRH